MGVRVSLVITTRNRAAHLRETLASFQRLNVPAELPAELLIVNNGSLDDTSKVVQAAHLAQLPIRLVHEPKPGQCHARNTGIANCSGEIIIFTDDDVRVPEHWLEGMCAPILTGEADGVAGGVRMASHLQRPWMRGVHYGWLACNGDWRPETIMMTGANMAFSRRVLTRVPGFDPELGPGALGFGDDTLFSLQLSKAGFALTRRYDVAVEHWFEEDRLLRKSWLDAARKRGRTKAYLAHHWFHSGDSGGLRGLAEAWLRLRKWRALNQRSPEREGCTEKELWLVRSVSFRQQLRVERRRPPAYARFGLVKGVG